MTSRNLTITSSGASSRMRIERRGIEKGIEQGIEKGTERGLRMGLTTGIELGLQLKFGNHGLRLLPETLKIQDVTVLQAVSAALRTVTTQELRHICVYKRTER